MILFASELFGADRAAASTPISPEAIGVNFTGSPPDLATAAAAGVGLARYQVIAGSNADAVVELTAAARLRLYPMLGLPASHGAAADAAAMATFVSSFAQRYGARASFWAQHPDLPYLPVQSYEIGNEPDITPTQPADQTSLHYADPASYAQVYEAARTALHQVEPTAQAVVGGILESGVIALQDGERYLSAIGPMDAVGYHPYLYDVTSMEADTLALRQWLDANGHRGVPLDINEFGATTGLTAGIAAWGSQAAMYTQWALCTPALRIGNVQAFWWGAIPPADNDVWFPMVDSKLAETPLGSAYLGEARTLTSQGCPAPPAPRPAAPTTGQRSSMGTPASARRHVAPHACRQAQRRQRLHPRGRRAALRRRPARCRQRHPRSASAHGLTNHLHGGGADHCKHLAGGHPRRRLRSAARRPFASCGR
jgi:hypothetical protein